MQEIIEFMKNAKITYLATVKEAQPIIRPMGSLMDVNGKLSFVTNNEKGIFLEIGENPNIEFCCIHGAKSLNISGKVFDNTNASAKEKVFEISPATAKRYGGDDSTLAIVSFEKATAVFADFKGNKEVIEIG